MTIAVDYSAGRIDPAVLLEQTPPIKVVCRYVTGPEFGVKSLSREEAQELLAAGISIVCLWETTADRMLGGAPAGHADGMAADQNLIDLGAPAGVKVIFAADFDVQPDQVQTCLEYTFAAAMAMGDLHLAGVYGGLRIVAAAADAGYTTIQTDAWSTGWDPRAAARQTGQQRTIGGISVDVEDIIELGALGAWTAGGATVSAPQIPASIAAKWSFLAAEFPPDAPYTDETATIWGDAGARAAAELAQQAVDGVKAVETKLDRIIQALGIGTS